MPSGAVFDAEVLDSRPGFASFIARGESALSLFLAEGGGHRVQRVPPTERRGRVHTSTITVAVIPLAQSTGEVRDSDIQITTTTGRGPGGQNRNKVETTVVALHVPTGLTVRIDGRSQHQNKLTAVAVLKGRVSAQIQQNARRQSNADRREQIGSGQRGDKVRTYRAQDDTVTDHRTGQKWRWSQWEKGLWQKNQS